MQTHGFETCLVAAACEYIGHGSQEQSPGNAVKVSILPRAGWHSCTKEIG